MTRNDNVTMMMPVLDSDAMVVATPAASLAVGMVCLSSDPIIPAVTPDT